MQIVFYTIYKVTNKINKKIYIGKHQTKNLDDDYLGSGKAIKSAISKYGIENFSKEIIFVFDNEAEMNAKEAELVTKEFVLENTNYNLCPGGKGGFGYLNNEYWDKEKRTSLGKNGGFANLDKLSNESKKKMHEGHKKGGVSGGNKTKNLNIGIHLQNKKVQSGEIDNPFKGKTHTEEWKKRHSAFMKKSQSGENNSQFGVKKKEETKSKIRDTLKNKPHIKCIYCEFHSSNIGLLSRWHNDNCKKKPI